MNLYSVIVKPLVTEKTSTMEVVGEAKTYTVQVAPKATKVDVKNAFKNVYGVDAEKVNIINTREKFKFTKKWVSLRKRTTKKAYVTLKEGQNVDFLQIK